MELRGKENIRILHDFFSQLTSSRGNPFKKFFLIFLILSPPRSSSSANNSLASQAA